MSLKYEYRRTKGRKLYSFTLYETSFACKQDLKEHFTLMHKGNKPLQSQSCDSQFSKKYLFFKFDI